MKRYRLGLDGMCREDAMGSYVPYSDAHTLELALAAERTRREEAEKVVDALDARDLDIFNLLSGYRAKYPRAPK